MDARTKHLIDKWLGKQLNGWKLFEYVNSGKSALVFKGKRETQMGAVKVFDPEIIEKFGRADEEERIKRELQLVGVKHPNLVEIFDGGHSPENDLYFIVMEFLDAPNLAMVLNEVPIEKVASIVSQVAAAAEFLEKKDIVHRDIKPDNIAISSDFGHAVLLDLGVIRPLKNAEPITDREKQIFVGTLQYASPEYLLREEENSRGGYRALTFYQLGAVLHDLLMRKRIFQDFADPYAKLVQAILHTKVQIDATGKPPHLVRLAKNCLVKDPKLRLEIVKWADFQLPDKSLDPAVTAKEQIRRRRAVATYEAAADERASDWKKTLKRQQQMSQILSRIAEQFRTECAEGELPPAIVVENPGEYSGTGTLSIHFKKWPTAGLIVGTQMVMRITAMDDDVEVIKLEAAAVCTNERIPLSQFDGHWCVLLTGVHDDAVVKAAIARFIYPVIAEALDQTEVIATPKWLEVQGAGNANE